MSNLKKALRDSEKEIDKNISKEKNTRIVFDRIFGDFQRGLIEVKDLERGDTLHKESGNDGSQSEKDLGGFEEGIKQDKRVR